MKVEMKRFGLPYCPAKEKERKNKITKHIVIFLCFFVVVATVLSIGLAIVTRNYISVLAINDTIDSTWIGSLASYLGGIVGGMISGILAFLGVFFTIRYYKESDEEKERVGIQPFLIVTVGSDKDVRNGFALGSNGDTKENTQEIKVTIKNIGNGFAKTLVIHTGFNFGGMAYNKVISVGETESLFFKVKPDNLTNGISFSIQYIDAMRNEYMQEYEMIESHGHIEIESGYPGFLKQV